MTGFNPGIAGGLALLLLTGACASDFKRPAPVDAEPLRARAVTKTRDGVRVSIDRRGIQPLWLEIENRSERSFYFLPTGLDPEYFAPLEVAFLYEDSFDDAGDAALGEHLEAMGFDSRSPIVPGETVSGFGLVVPVPGTEPAQQRLRCAACTQSPTSWRSTYSQALAKIGFVKGAGREAGSVYRTDGFRSVLVFGGNAVSLAEVDFFDWERLVGR